MESIRICTGEFVRIRRTCERGRGAIGGLTADYLSLVAQRLPTFPTRTVKRRTPNARRPNARLGGMVWAGLFQVLWQEHRVFSGTVALLFMNRGTERRFGVYHQQPSFHLVWQPTFYYPFFTLSAFMATTAVELALRLRLQKGRNDYSGLKALFDEGIREGLLKDEGFPSREAVREISAAMFGQDAESPEALPSGNIPSYAETVAEWMRYFRNVFAHPSGHWILFPGQAINFLTLGGEVINQLWPGETPASVGNSELGA